METKIRKSRVFAISMPPEMAAKAEAMAKAENRTISELFREAFRTYQADKLRTLFADAATYAASVDSAQHSDQEIVQAVKEVRAEVAAEHRAKSTRRLAVAG